jgi:hypothetical protein
MLADGQTDMTKLIVGFRNFTDAPIKALKNCPIGQAHQVSKKADQILKVLVTANSRTDMYEEPAT